VQVRFVPGLLFLLCAFVASCGDDTSPEATSDAGFAAEAERLVPGAVLTVDDLDGFETVDITSLDEQADLSPACDIFQAVVVFPEAVATAESEGFSGRRGEQLLNYAAIYETADGAAAALAATEELRLDCTGEFEDAVRQVARSELDRLGIDLGPLADIDVTISGYDPPEAGDEVIGHRLNVDVNLIATRQQYNLDVIVVREGRVLGALLYGQFGPVTEEAEGALLERVTEKLSGTEGELPD
jgi:hypothetical protein